jgi:hypothetical protein
MARLRDVVVDCHRPSALAHFWAALLDGYEVAPYDQEEIERLRANGILDVQDDPSVLVQPRSGMGPRLFFTLVPESKVVKNRVHIDVDTADVATELARIAGLGGTVLQRYDDGHVVLADPEGNEFCVLPA